MTAPAQAAQVGELPATTAAVARDRTRRRRLPAAGTTLLALLALWLLARLLLGGRWTLPLAAADLTPLQLRLNDLNDWVSGHRNTSPLFLYFFNEIRLAVDTVGTAFTQVLSRTDVGLGIPEIGWLGTTVLVTALAYAVGNVRVAVLTLAVFCCFVLQGLWADAMDTFALVLASVLFALAIGLPLGIWSGTSRRVHRILTPVLDFMQILPSFAYLAPLVLIFLIGPASAIIATVVFAAPPVIRLTAHGLQQVPAVTREAADSLGVTGWQRLRTVLLPMARRTVVIGINQTFMAALSMVTIASLIGAPGLGLTVAQALQSLDVGTAFNAGVAIVLMAIAFDRVATAAGERTETALRSGRSRRRARRIAVAAALLVAVLAVYLSRTYLWAAEPPTGWPDLGRLLTDVGDTVSGWLQAHLSTVTGGLKDAVTYGVLNPLEALLTGSPFWVTGIVVTVVAWLAGRWRTALTAVLCLAAIVWLGVWQDAMATLAATLLATVAVVVLGVVVGVWMGRSRMADRIIRPVLDAAQTMPAFVYLVPFLALFDASRFTAIVAAVVYAAPAAIKIVADGIAQVPAATVEAATAFGSTRWQVVTRVQLPMSARSLALATNQGLIYALSMVVIGGMVGAGALGYDVVAGLSQDQLFGKGLAAGLTLVALGIVLDRITQAAAGRSGRRPGAARPRARSTAPALPAAGG
ncbi:ABC transporter permease [Nakamurella endophytica]|uniref:Glycine/betaine ABC transporter permease n=1 Tax=Nakamurella endophytica TaxID=1748367 RepID=A0A917WAP4_9ACTN|nr:ABC transporter permease subunit [Nakamurella endophytica]GGL89256.1 glycine/betaine ABC transporter permease [Nakamurella endophytica]